MHAFSLNGRPDFFVNSCSHFLVCWCVFFAAAILDLLHSGDDVRAGREVQVEPI